MSRRQTLAALSPNQVNGRSSLAPGKAGQAKDGSSRQSLKPGASGRPSVAPRPAERPSSMGLDRRSSAYGKPGTAKADPRPLSDKNFFNGCIRNIIAYASTHSYPYALSPKVLTSPTGKDFAQLAFWLFQRFDPTLKAFGKVEDEVPLFFKRLNYPFQLSKSALFAVGSPHSWPSLLNYDDRAEDAAGSQFDEKQRSERQFFVYASTTYRYFLAGDDPKAQAADDEMLGQFRERKAALLQSNQASSRCAHRLQLQLSKLIRWITCGGSPLPLAAAQAAKQEVLADQRKFQEVIAGNQAQRASLQKKLEERQADLEAKRAALAAVRADNESLAARVAGQALSKADVNRMVAERQKQKKLLEGVVSQRESLQQRLYQAEVQRAAGVAYELPLNRAATAQTELLSGDIKGVVRPGLLSLRERYRLRGRELAEDGLVLREQLDAAREANGERLEELAALKRQVGAAEERHRGLKEALECDIAAIGGHADKIKGEVACLRNAMLSKLLDAEEKLRAAAAEHEATSRRCAAEVEELNHSIMAGAELLLQHAASMRGGIQDLAAAVGGITAEVQAAEQMVRH
ncbi:HEC/Ndc80p family-domain-containing protein [Scenedesmus sp. NREL 46B-D3]|nr:HEC/Ndc80p family-domain-containing protein [Scenedesmus sp. NREL 46B-D3]